MSSVRGPVARRSKNKGMVSNDSEPGKRSNPKVYTNCTYGPLVGAV